MFKPIDRTGQRSGNWVAIKRVGRKHWLCRCDCGREHVRMWSVILNRGTKTCEDCRGWSSKLRHGLSKTPEYRIWNGMKERCLNPRAINYARYGGRGITLDPRWMSLASFIEDMGMRPSQNLQLDRIDNRGPYCKANCRWVDKKENARNRRTNVNVEWNGETMCISAWAEKTGIKQDRIRRMLRNGLSTEEIFNK